ncbi:16S rRNA (uracil(1498)-N(3))-methyltransferase [Comamonas odontotermitis]|uniref:16S rRNA (uracil(1498)-N(3))-methyltransferase n=1 Tax=Comamonas odontotermitis TaxID=379895 RepID=UPI001CC49FD4|nr:16S rRNA (uracil(1498)-N(3))-methyltransferase [Comamonas odontotermitis]UBB17140.1 16S rRNA (uracil(1498)-N(3))-methyltransferase [Comamonas odontotermitis]
MPRFYCPVELRTGAELDLPAEAARHVQVFRMQPGDGITLFNGTAGVPAGEYAATIMQMGRNHVTVRIDSHAAVEREAAVAVHLLAGITAGERMEWLVEKATELGVASITPLEAERSVTRLKGDRATKRQERWQAIAASACEQCGRNQVPVIHAPVDLAQWSRADALAGAQRLVLSLAEGTQPLPVALQARAATQPVVFLSGPEGGLSPAEEALARTHGFAPVTLGARVLRAETAPLAALAYLAAL